MSTVPHDLTQQACSLGDRPKASPGRTRTYLVIDKDQTAYFQFKEISRMHRHRQSFALSLSAVAILALAITSGCSYSEEGNAKEPAITGSNTRTIGAAGSTFIAPLMASWASSYEQVHPVHVNYRPIGSGGGIDEIKQGRLEFAASDAPLSDDQLKEMPPLVQVPATAGPVCYHLQSAQPQRSFETQRENAGGNLRRKHY